MSRLPKPSQLRPPTKFNSRLPLQTSDDMRLLRPTSSVAQNATEPATAFKTATRNPLHQFPKRRSKSYSDLRTLSGRPTTLMSELKKTIPGRAAAPANARTLRAVKRPALGSLPEDTNSRPKLARIVEKCENAKPKAAPKSKIPDWDYKARFNALSEKHAALLNSHKEAKEKLSELATIEDDHNRLTHEADRLTRELAECKLKNGQLQVIESEHDLLKEKHEECAAELERVRRENDALSETGKRNVETIEALRSKIGVLVEELDSLTKKHDDLLESHGTLVPEHDELKRQYRDTVEKLTRSNDSNASLQRELAHCKATILSSEALRRRLHNTVQDLKGNIRVFCRVRPPINDEEKDRLQCYISYLDECSIEIRKSRESVRSIGGKPADLKLEFSFDRIFQPDSTQGDIFEELAQLVQSALDGYNVCVFAYGQTGSGKTYTMHGEPPDRSGMIPKSVDRIFETVKELEKVGWRYEVEASFLEIYNETIRDLLQPGSNLPYDIQYNEGTGTSVKNLKVKSVGSARELKQLMCTANRNRAVAVTDFNEHSSRSHSVTKICIRGHHEETNVRYYGSVNLVDLAGSERSKTISDERFKETVSINQSLSTLGNVMLALHNKDSHVPYRNSKLTYLLQHCLGGNSKTLMIVNVSPFEDCYGESVSSLRFAAKVKEVKITSKRNRLLPLTK